MLRIIQVCFVIINVEVILCQFPRHVDLQKLDEVTYNNEQYSLLKPTVHIVDDYFKQFIQKRHNKNFPTERLFLDKNGFRHYWKGINYPQPNEKVNSLRKTEDVAKQINSTKVLKKVNGGNVDKLKIETNNEDNGKTTTSYVNPDATVKRTPRRRKKILNYNFTLRPNLRQNKGEGTVIKTTFFCPFFGIITMTVDGEL